MENLCKKCYCPYDEECSLNSPKSKCENFTDKDDLEFIDLCCKKDSQNGCLTCERYNNDCPVSKAYEDDAEGIIEQMKSENYGYISSDNL